MVLPLEGLKVLDLTSHAPGPYCTMILGDFGADIISIEQPVLSAARPSGLAKHADSAIRPKEMPSPDSPYNPVNRNKRSIKLNLKMDSGRQVLYRLAKSADVVVEGSRPGVAKRLGIDYQTLKQNNERLIYCSITGYGQDGPYSRLAGHDINYLSHGGAVSVISHPGEPPALPGNLIGDMAAGGMQAAIGILIALAAREKTGKGQFVDISMTDGIVSLLSMYLGAYLQCGEVVRQEDRLEATPFYNFYKAKDGKLISIGCIEPGFYANLCRVMGCEEFIAHQTNAEKADEIKSYFRQKFLTRTRDEWFDILSQRDIPVGKVYALDELTSDVQLRYRDMIVEIDHPVEGKVKQAGISIKLSETPGVIRNPGTALQDHTVEILTELGYSPEDIRKLQKERAAGTSEDLPARP